MKIVRKRNVAFKNQPHPIASRALPRLVKPINARAKPLIAKLTTDVGMSQLASGVTLEGKRSETRGSSAPIRVTLEDIAVGKRVFPAGMRAKAVKPRGDKSKRFSRPLKAEGFLPPHLSRSLRPRRVPESMRHRPRATAGIYYGPGRSRPTTIFPPDDRREFFDTSYPWSTCGRVDVAGGSGSGVLVGPRHLLTASHMMNWGNDNTVGWLQFRPMLFDTSTPFGESWGTWVYYKRKNEDETLGWIDEQYDYVCIVLDRRIGDMTGWMGAKGYTDDWDGGDYWSHVGYPGDLAGALRPTFQGGFSMNGIWYELDSHEAMSHSADVWPGQSGGPMFGWWTGESWPSAVAVQSTQNSDENKASGGQDLVDLILQARSDFP